MKNNSRIIRLVFLMLVIGTFVSTMWVKADEPLSKYRVERMEFDPNAPGAAGSLSYLN